MTGSALHHGSRQWFGEQLVKILHLAATKTKLKVKAYLRCNKGCRKLLLQLRIWCKVAQLAKDPK